MVSRVHSFYVSHIGVGTWAWKDSGKYKGIWAKRVTLTIGIKPKFSSLPHQGGQYTSPSFLFCFSCALTLFHMITWLSLYFDVENHRWNKTVFKQEALPRYYKIFSSHHVCNYKKDSKCWHMFSSSSSHFIDNSQNVNTILLNMLGDKETIRMLTDIQYTVSNLD